MKNKKILVLTVLIMFALFITGCADVANVEACTSDPYGFWGGLWHGMISPLSFFGSLIFDSIDMYAKNNVGAWYDFGFVLGAGILGFGAGKKS